MKKLIGLLFISGFCYGEACQITSPLPVPVSIQGCTFSSNLPGGSTSYINNSPTLQSGVSFYVPVATATQFSTSLIQWADGTVQTTASSGSGGYALEPATVTPRLAQGLKTSSTLVITTTAVVGTTTTLTSTMSVVLASAPQNTAWITLTLPDAATNPGVSLMVYKVDYGTAAIKLQGAGTDLIEGTGTIRLDAPAQHANVYSTGAGWVAGIGGIQYTPTILGAPTDADMTQGVANSSNVAICPFYNPVPVLVRGFRYFGISGAGQIGFQIYDKNGSLVVSTGPVTFAGFGQTTVSLATPRLLPAGMYYYGFQAANTGITIGSKGTNGGNGSLICSAMGDTDMDPPAAFTFGTPYPRDFVIFILVNGGWAAP